MSTKLSFREALERQGATKVAPPLDSASPIVDTVAFAALGGIDRPIDVIRALKRGGVSSRRARMILDHLAMRQTIAVEISAADSDEVLRQMSRLGVMGARLETAPKVDPKAIRDRQGLSQPEFARLYGFAVETIKNWEQGRYAPDGPARVLLTVIDRFPHAVINARTALPQIVLTGFQFRNTLRPGSVVSTT